VVNLAVLACVLRATTKKVANVLEEEKCTPDKILATKTKNLLKFTSLISRLKALKLLKLTKPYGREFQTLTARSQRNVDVAMASLGRG